jgi:hypothetical protein
LYVPAKVVPKTGNRRKQPALVFWAGLKNHFDRPKTPRRLNLIAESEPVAFAAVYKGNATRDLNCGFVAKHFYAT